MRTFFPKKIPFRGSLNYIYSITNHNFPKVEISGTKTGDEAIDIIANPTSANIAYSSGSNKYTNVDIDLGEYKLLPSHYQLSTMIGGTPPLNFSLLGSNNLSEEWIPIGKYRYDRYLRLLITHFHTNIKTRLECLMKLLIEF